MQQPTEQPRDWYFTFGHGHTLPDGEPAKDRYVVIRGTYNSTRTEMFRRFGRRWAMQYRNTDEAGVARFGLTQYGETIVAGGAS